MSRSKFMFFFFLNKFITLLNNNNLLTVDVYYKFVNHNCLMYTPKKKSNLHINKTKISNSNNTRKPPS